MPEEDLRRTHEDGLKIVHPFAVRAQRNDVEVFQDEQSELRQVVSEYTPSIQDSRDEETL